MIAGRNDLIISNLSSSAPQMKADKFLSFVGERKNMQISPVFFR